MRVLCCALDVSSYKFNTFHRCCTEAAGCGMLAATDGALDDNVAVVWATAAVVGPTIFGIGISGSSTTDNADSGCCC